MHLLPTKHALRTHCSTVLTYRHILQLLPQLVLLFVPPVAGAPYVTQHQQQRPPAVASIHSHLYGFRPGHWAGTEPQVLREEGLQLSN
jgi:hypothetical protein